MNYGQMKAQFKKLLNRKDCTDDLVPTFFDQSIARAQRELRLPHMERVMDIDTSAGTVSEVIIPDDWLETVAFIASDNELQDLDIGAFVRAAKLSPAGDPQFYTRKYDRWLITPVIPQGGTAYLLYYGEETPLVNDSDETTLCSIAADLVIYGALTYAADYFLDDRGPGWEQKWSFFRDQIQAQASDGDNRNGSNQIAPAYTFDDGA